MVRMSSIFPRAVLGSRIAVPDNLAPVYDVDATAYFNAIITNGGAPLSLTAKSGFNAFIVGLKADGIWGIISRLVFLANESSVAALTDIRNPAKLWTAISAPTFTALSGYKGNAISSYLSAVDLLSADAIYTQNSACHFVYQHGAVSASRRYNIGQNSGRNSSIGIDGNDIAFVNSTSALSVAGSHNIGFISAARALSTTIEMYANGASIGSAAVASSAIAALAITGLKAQTTFSPDSISVLGYGAYINAARQTALYNRILTLAAAIGAAL